MDDCKCGALLYRGAILQIVCCAVLGYINNNLKAGSTRYCYGIEHSVVASKSFSILGRAGENFSE